MLSACPLPEVLPLVSTVILADDLTGACDSAAAFAACGRETWVVLDVMSLQSAQGHVISCSMETRNLSPRETELRMREASKRIPLAASLLFCKIDSAGRGAIGAATLSLLDATDCDWALVTPAFPGQGRTVRNGVLHITEEPGATRQLPLEPLFPESLRALIAGGDVEERSRQIVAALDTGRRVLICDAETREDLSTLVEAARRASRGRVLWCGSAGLARALAKLDFTPANVALDEARDFGAEGACLVFAGTPHPVTAGQMETLAGVEGVLQINCESEAGFFAPRTRCGVVKMECGKTSDAQIQSVWALAQAAGGVRGLVVTGGDTASMVLRALGAESILVRGEVAGGIPWGVIEGGLAAGRRIVTKSGGFGGRSALVDIVGFLERTA